MSYEPLALRYRPRVFADVVGHEAVASTLKQAVASGRIANAYLFSGSRGVGKTSAARILAKALNCPNIVEGEPCGRCEICTSIARGDDLDVLEIDGASNRGIEEIRTVRDNAGYAPARSRFKIYIIDEVHMLTVQAFNALLKTLEEPPAHVRFIFATTEPEAVPETIVSRCQRFEFRRIPVEAIERRLADICRREELTVPSDVLRELALKCEGGLRDALSLLDQAISFAPGGLSLEALDTVLGRIDSELLSSVVVPMGGGDLGALLDALDRIFATGRDAEDIIEQLGDVFREAMLREARGLRGGGEGRRSALVAEVRQHFPMDRLLLALRLLLNTRREIKLAGHGRLQLEIVALKIARSVDLVNLTDLGTKPLSAASGEAPPSTAPRSSWVRSTPPSERALKPVAPAPSVPSPEEPRRGPGSSSSSTPPPVAPEVAPKAVAQGVPPSVRSGPPPLEVVKAEWPRFLKNFREQRPRLAALLDRSEPERISAQEFGVRLAPGSEFAKGQLQTTHRKLVEDLFESLYGIHLRWSFSVAPATENPESVPKARRVLEDPSVRKLVESFGGGVVALDEAKPASRNHEESIHEGV